MTLEELLKLIKDGKENEIVSKFKEISDKNVALANEVSKLEDENIKTSGVKSTFESKLNEISTSLGVKADELTAELLKSKINGNDDYKKDLSELETTLANIKKENDNLIALKDKEIFDKTLDLELLKTGSKIKTVSNVALDVVLRELKKGLTKDDKGSLIYKDENGKTIRKDGVMLTISDKLKQLKENDEYKCFFVSEQQSGSGYNSSSASGDDDSGLSEIAKQMKAKAASLGINL